MNKPMILAAGLMTLTTGVHFFMGTPEISAPVMSAELHPVVAATNYVVWHGITLLLAAMALALFWLSWHPSRPLSVFLAGFQISFAALFLAVSIFMLGGVFTLPQWTVFTLVPLLMLLAIRRKTARAA